jgi:MinD superfamily P-loop ATPase
MWVGVLSGKGGTGKTSVAAALSRQWDGAVYIDCDVEEPNGHIFLKPVIDHEIPVACGVPDVDGDRCDGCGVCASICQFNALAVVNKEVIVFPEICHHCGACWLACPQHAIREGFRTIGIIKESDDGRFRMGQLHIGEPSGVPIIGKLKQRTDPEHHAVFDCPPGASCSVVKSLQGIDYAVVVTEPTAFGFHDMKIICNLLDALNMPYGIVINKCMDQPSEIRDFCQASDVPILLEIPFSMSFAQMYSKGTIPPDFAAGLADRLMGLFPGGG